MREYKIIKTTHNYSPYEDKVAYAIVGTTYMRAEPDAKRGVYLDKSDDMFIIATDIKDANDLLIFNLFRLVQKHVFDLKNECDLNGFESQSSEC